MSEHELLIVRPNALQLQSMAVLPRLGMMNVNCSAAAGCAAAASSPAALRLIVDRYGVPDPRV